MSRLLATAFAIAWLVACGEELSRPDASVPGPDAELTDGGNEDSGELDGGPDDDGSVDAGPGDTGPSDTGPSDTSAPSLGDQLDITLLDSTVRGELVYVYDQRQWWANRDERTWLLFVASALAPYPDDRSFRFIDRSDIVSFEIAPSSSPPHLDVLRDAGYVLERSPLDSVARVITGHESYHLEEDGRGDFAWDLVVTSSSTADRWVGDGFDNEDYLVFDRPLYLPTGGTVVEVIRDAPDNLPGFYPESAINNLVGVHVGGQYYVYILHFREGSIPIEVEPGAILPAGSYLGRAGNSGVTLEPHVHLTMLYYDEITQRTWSVPSEFIDLYLSSAPSGGQISPRVVPETGDWISSTPF